MGSDSDTVRADMGSAGVSVCIEAELAGCIRIGFHNETAQSGHILFGTIETKEFRTENADRGVSQVNYAPTIHFAYYIIHFVARSDKSYRPEHRKKLIEDIERKLQQPSDLISRNSLDEPTLEYEKLRRRIRSNTEELWNFINSEVTKVKKSLKATGDQQQLSKQLDGMLSLAGEHKRSLISDIRRMQEVDGYESWRFKESTALSDLVQKRLTQLQNPEDCGTAQKLVCRLNKVSADFVIDWFAFCVAKKYS